MSGPAYRIEIGDLVARCWEPGDAANLKEAVDSSLEHLRPWMEWALNEPADLETKIKLLRRARGRFDLEQDFVYGIFSAEGRVLGGSGLHTRLGEGALEIGYWVRSDAINRGVATRIAAALTRVAFEIQRVNRVEIHCAPENVRSAAVPQKLGYTHEATLRQRLQLSDGSWRDSMVWTLLAENYPASAAAKIALAAFDVIGRRIL